MSDGPPANGFALAAVETPAGAFITFALVAEERREGVVWAVRLWIVIPTEHPDEAILFTAETDSDA